VNDEAIARTSDPDGREVIFDEGSYRHLEERRPVFLRYIDVILETVARPDHRQPDPIRIESASTGKTSSSPAAG
jgi:hypothetical protein